MIPLGPFKKFLKGQARNAWITSGGYAVYVRKAMHGIGGGGVQTFDIANIEAEERHRGKGNFRRFVQELKQLLKDDPNLRGDITTIYVEEVQNDRLAASLPSMGFTRQPNTRSFYMDIYERSSVR